MKPILFSTPMVQAIVAGNKTKTRRVIKPQYAEIVNHGKRKRLPLDDYMKTEKDAMLVAAACAPYQAGDILWVRETWLPFVPAHVIDTRYAYKANMTATSEDIRQKYLGAGFPYKWRPSIFMPRAAARLFLRVTDVRVERVQDISEGDAIAEGAPHCLGKSTCGGHDERCEAADPGRWYRMLWDELNAKRDGGCYAWGENPWVWVYTFERISKEEALAADCA